MGLKIAQNVSLLGATITTGLMAGLFAAFAYAVMPGLREASDRTFVEAMQRINTAILNGWFMTCFAGALLLAVAAVALHIPKSGHAALPWVTAALVLYGVTFMITGAVNVPLNNALAQAGKPGHPHHLEAVRTAFEAKWVTWNVVRAVTNVLAFAALAWALVTSGRG
ncbi:MAG TPA: anthrone oxygenase family protein [Streptosporangiaceae bacterium]|jgi:uncharacterized membrane protein